MDNQFIIIMNTGEKLSMIRNILKRVKLEIQYINDSDSVSSKTFRFSPNINKLHKDATEILKILRDNHVCNIETLHKRSLKVTNGSTIEIKWQTKPDKDFFKDIVNKKIEDGDYDYDEDVDARPNLDAPFNKDLRVDILQFNDLDNLPEWIKGQLSTEHTLLASEHNRLDLLKFMKNDLNIDIHKRSISYAIINENSEMVEYLLNNLTDTDCCIFDNIENFSTESWELFKKVFNMRPISIPNRILGQVIKNKDMFEWFLEHGANKKYAIMQAINNNMIDRLKNILDQNDRDDVYECFYLMINLSPKNIDVIYGLLVDYCLFSHKLNLEIINTQAKYNSFKKCLNYIPYNRFYELISPYPQFIEWDIDVFDLFAYRDSINVIDHCRKTKEGIERYRQFSICSGNISKEKHKRMMYPVHNLIKHAYDVGFRVYRSFFRDITFTDSKYLFKICEELNMDIIEDVPIDVWEEQLSRFYLPSIDIPQLLVQKKDIMVQIYDIKEAKDSDGYWNPVCIYDIRDCSIEKYKMDESGKLVIYMKGVNNGKKRDLEHPNSDKEWIDENHESFIIKHDYIDKMTMFYHKRSKLSDYYIKLNIDKCIIPH